MKKYKRNIAIEAAAIGDELGMLNVNEGKYYVLDSIGKDIWDFLDKEKSIEEIVEDLIKKYDVTKEQCHSDIEELIKGMLNKTIVLEV